MTQKISPALLNTWLLGLTGKCKNKVDGGRLPSLSGDGGFIRPATISHPVAEVSYYTTKPNEMYYVGISLSGDLLAKEAGEIHIVLSSPDVYKVVQADGELDRLEFLNAGESVSLIFSVKDMDGVHELRMTCGMIARQYLGWSEEMVFSIFPIM